MVCYLGLVYNWLLLNRNLNLRVPMINPVLARDGNGNSRGILGSQNPARYVCRYGIHGIPVGRAARDGTVFRMGFRAGIFQTRGFKCL